MMTVMLTLVVGVVAGVAATRRDGRLLKVTALLGLVGLSNETERPDIPTFYLLPPQLPR